MITKKPGTTITALTAGIVTLLTITANAQTEQIQRGKYLATLGGCNDCHTPGYFFGKPDMARYLGGSEVAFEVAGLGVFHGPNLTPDEETGLGSWTDNQVIAGEMTVPCPVHGRRVA